MEIGKIVLGNAIMCPQCNGTGLAQYVGTPAGQCNKCMGAGTIEAPQKPDPLGSDVFALLSDNCACCGKVIEVNHVRLGAGEHSICMGCEGAEIDVWKVECNGSWYVEKNFANVAEILEDIEHDEPYTISKLKMMFAQYISLPEFQGF